MAPDAPPSSRVTTASPPAAGAGNDPDSDDARPAAAAVVPSERPVCPEGCTNAPSEPEHTAPGSVACSLDIAWSSPSWIEDHTYWPTRNLRADSHGNVYYVGTFTGSIDLGLGTLTAGARDAFVLKLSPTCAPIWVKQLGGDSGTDVSFAAIAIDADDNLIIAGEMNGTVDFGAGEVTSVATEEYRGTAGLVLKLAPDGTALWSRTLRAKAGTNLESVGVSGSGDIVVSGRSDSVVHFEGTTQPDGLAYPGIFTAAVSADGEPAAIDQITSDDIYASIAVDGSGRVAISGWAYDAEGTNVLANYDWAPKLHDHYVIVHDASGASVWSRHLESFDVAAFYGLFGSNIEFDRDGNLILEYGRSHDPQIVRKIDSAGMDVWTRSNQYVGGEIAWYGRLATDTHGNIVHVDEVTPDITLDGESFDVRGVRDFLVRKRDPSGELIWSAQIGGDGDDVDWALATDPSDAVWVGSEQIDDALGHGTITITKLVP